MQAPSKFRRIGLGIAVIVVTTVLASCGGSDNGSPPPVADTNMPPASASASPTGFIAFLKTLVPTMPDNTTPLDVANFVAPTDDTGAFDTTI